MNLLKKITYTMLALAAVLFTACSDDSDDRFAPGSEAVAHFTVNMGGDTRAIGDAGSVNSITAAVYDGGKLVYETSPVALNAAKQAGIDLTLIVGHEYQIIFWAQNGEKSPYSFDPDAPTVKVDYEAFLSGGFAQMEKLDAFFDAQTIKFTGNSTGAVNLARPLAMLNFADPDVQPLSGTHTAELTLTNVPTSFSPFADTKFAGADDFTFIFGDFPGDADKLTTAEGTYYYVTSNYLFPSATATAATLNLKSGSEVLKTTSIPAGCISLVANTRTNVLGSIVQAPLAWKPVPCEVENDGTYLVKIPQNLLWLSQNSDEFKPEKIKFVSDIDVQDNELTGIKIQPGTTVDGNGKTIKNAKVTDGALFGDAECITVTNLTIDGSVFGSQGKTGNVGALVNNLKGSSIFENVAINNSEVTTSEGAAGGIVGYISRKNETDRAEVLNATFTGCTINEECLVNGTLANGLFVGLFSGYDNNETLTFKRRAYTEPALQMFAGNFVSPYCEGNEAAWLAGNDYTAFNNFLGNEKYYRGTIMYGDNRFIPKWDGVTTVEPLLANAAYDSGTTAGANKYVVYSPFDLAGVREKIASPTAIYLRQDIDMNGQGADGKYNVPSNFTKSVCESTDDNDFDPFSYVTTLDGKKSDTENYSIYNLKIEQIEQERAAFILYASGTTVHQNINFRNCQTVAVHKPVSTDAKAYGAILVSNVDATYTMQNVHAYDCKVFALQKIGTLAARISGTSTLANNSVNDCYVENYECFIDERFTSGRINKSINIPILGTAEVYEVYCNFYPHGEVGGMYGFIQGNSKVTDCKVNSTIVYGYGQDGKMATIDGNRLAKTGISLLGMYKVPGRHVSTMIGNIRATGTVTLTGCSVDSNSKCTNRWDKHSNSYPYIGHAYFVNFSDSEGSVTVDNKKLTLGDCTKSKTK